jgi:hypothetical protein
MTNTRSFLAKVSAIACLSLCKRLYLEPPYVLGVCGDRISVRGFLWEAIAAHQESAVGLSQKTIESKTRCWGSEGDHCWQKSTRLTKLPAPDTLELFGQT